MSGGLLSPTERLLQSGVGAHRVITSGHERFVVRRNEESGDFVGAWEAVMHEREVRQLSGHSAQQPLNWPAAECAFIGCNVVPSLEFVELLMDVQTSPNVCIVSGQFSNICSLPDGERTLYATAAVLKNDMVLPYAGELRSALEDDRRQTQRYRMIFRANAAPPSTGRRWCVDGQRACNEARYLNSSRGTDRTPNVKFAKADLRGLATPWLQALRDIAVGEELLADYAYDTAADIQRAEAAQRAYAAAQRAHAAAQRAAPVQYAADKRAAAAELNGASQKRPRHSGIVSARAQAASASGGASGTAAPGTPAGGSSSVPAASTGRTGGKRMRRCGQCAGCRIQDCGKCRTCRDKVKFGGLGKQKQICTLKKNAGCDNPTAGTSGYRSGKYKCRSSKEVAEVLKNHPEYCPAGLTSAEFLDVIRAGTPSQMTAFQTKPKSFWKDVTSTRSGHFIATGLHFTHQRSADHGVLITGGSDATNAIGNGSCAPVSAASSAAASGGAPEDEAGSGEECFVGVTAAPRKCAASGGSKSSSSSSSSSDGAAEAVRAGSAASVVGVDYLIDYLMLERVQRGTKPYRWYSQWKFSRLPDAAAGGGTACTAQPRDPLFKWLAGQDK